MSRRLRICFLTHYFPPEVGAPQTRIDLLARTLAARGAAVTIHTGFPHYPSGQIAAPYRNRPWLREHRDGVAILRSAVYPAPNQGFGRRLVDHATFALSALATAGLTGPADVVVGETPPLFTAAAGAAYARLKRAAYVPYVADRWPATAVELGALRSRPLIAAASLLERSIYSAADVILAPTDGIVAALRDLPVAGAKTHRVWPVVDVARFDPRPSDRPRPSEDPRAGAGPGPLRVLFAGTVGLAQGLETLVEASRLAGPTVVMTTIAGDGADAGRIGTIVREQAIVNVRLLGAVPAGRIPGLYFESAVSVVTLRDLPIFRGALPTKLLEAMAAGRALVLAGRGESAALVTKAGAGLVVAPGDAVGLASAFRRLRADQDLRSKLGQAGRRYALANFGAEHAADEWLRQLTAAVTAHAGVGSHRS